MERRVGGLTRLGVADDGTRKNLEFPPRASPLPCGSIRRRYSSYTADVALRYAPSCRRSLVPTKVATCRRCHRAKLWISNRNEHIAEPRQGRTSPRLRSSHKLSLPRLHQTHHPPPSSSFSARRRGPGGPRCKQLGEYELELATQSKSVLLQTNQSHASHVDSAVHLFRTCCTTS